MVVEIAVKPVGDAADAIRPSGDVAGSSRKILIYGMNYSPEMAGVGYFTGEIAEYMASVGIQVTVVTTPPHYPGWKIQQGFTNRYSSNREKGIDVYRAPLLLHEKMDGIRRLLAPLSFAIASAPVAFWRILKERPHVVLCVEPTLFAAPMAQLAAGLVGARTSLHVQDLEVDAAFAVGHLSSRYWLKKLGFAFERFALRHFDTVVTISNRMAQRLVAKGVPQDRMVVVRNWVDLSHIYPLKGENPYRSELGYSPDDFIVLYSGNIGAKQGLNVLLDAAEALKDDPSVRFAIAGEGPAKADLVSRYGHLHNVRFLPFQPYSRLNAFLNMADLHALPQDASAADLVLPSKLGGMLASGKPVLVTAGRGTELYEFLDGVSLLVPAGDSGAMAAAIEKAAREGTSLDSQRASELVLVLDKRKGLRLLTEAVLGAKAADTLAPS